MNAEKTMGSSYRVSIVIPTLGAEKTLGECLRSIKRQEYGGAEIVIADGGSSDRTVEIAREFSCRVVDYSGRTRAAGIGSSGTRDINQADGARSSPDAADIDGDSKEEILCGDGDFLRFLNCGGSVLI